MSELQVNGSVVPLRPDQPAPAAPRPPAQQGRADRRRAVGDGAVVGAVLAAVVVGVAIREAGVFGVPVAAVVLIVGRLAADRLSARLARWAGWQSMRNRAVLIRKALPAAPAADTDTEQQQRRTWRGKRAA